MEPPPRHARAERCRGGQRSVLALALGGGRVPVSVVRGGGQVPVGVPGFVRTRIVLRGPFGPGTLGAGLRPHPVVVDRGTSEPDQGGRPAGGTRASSVARDPGGPGRLGPRRPGDPGRSMTGPAVAAATAAAVAVTAAAGTAAAAAAVATRTAAVAAVAAAAMDARAASDEPPREERRAQPARRTSGSYGDTPAHGPGMGPAQRPRAGPSTRTSTNSRGRRQTPRRSHGFHPYGSLNPAHRSLGAIVPRGELHRSAPPRLPEALPSLR